MIDPVNYVLIAIVTACFGLLIGFQLTHIAYVRRLTRLAKRCLDSGTIAPVLVELESARRKK